MLPAKFGSIWSSCFRGEDFFNISQSEKRINLGGHFHQQIWPPRAILVSDWLLFKKIFSSETAWQNGAKLGRKHLCKILYKALTLANQKKELILAAMFVGRMEPNEEAL
jgi:hypothetical protein